MSANNFGEILSIWAAQEPTVRGLVLIGSRVRAADDTLWQADAHSDWDFQIITSHPRMFADDGWLRRLPFGAPLVYSSRTARLGLTPKIYLLFEETEADIVIFPSGPARVVKTLVALGLHKRVTGLRRALQPLAVANRPGWRFLKGASEWDGFYRKIVDDIPDPRLGDEDVRRVADGFVCDYVGVLRKIDRGELLTAQWLIHRDLADVNFRLLHELRLRRGQRSFPEARRIERMANREELQAVTVETGVNTAELRAAVEKCAATCRLLVTALVGERWRWPLC